MKTQLLRDPDIVPDSKTLADYLGKETVRVYGSLKRLVEADFGLDLEWRYYKDGKAWLCKVTEGKKMFKKATPTGKLIPLILSIYHEAQLSDLERIIKYKQCH